MNAIAPQATFLGARRVGLVSQSEAAECGLACLAMVANHHGHDLDLAAMRRRFGASARGMGLRALMQAADAVGLTSRPLRLDVETLNELQLPAILHWDLNHYVVLERVSRGRAYVLDPARDGRWHDAASLSRHFTGVALELRASDAFEPQQERRRLRLAQLWSGATGLKRSLGQAALLSLVLQLYVLASPYLLQVVIDDALPALDTDLLATVAVGFALFAVVNAAALLLRSQVLLAAGTATGFGIASNVARHLFRLPIDWFEKRGVGDILSRFQSVAPIQLLLTQNASAAAIDGVLALLTLALMLVYSATMTLVPIAGLILYACLRALTIGPERRAQNDRIVAQGKEQGAMIETLRGIVTLRLAGNEAMRHAVWQNRLSEALAAGYAHDRVKAVQVAGAALLTALEGIALVSLGARAAMAGGFSIGMIFAFLAYRLQFATATRALIDSAADWRMLRLHLERLADISLTASDPGFVEAPGHARTFKGGVSLRGVRFAYGPHEPEVLAGVDLDVAPGEHIAITGPSGGGKSTLAKILLGLIEPDMGEVLVDGVPLTRFGRRAFRERIGAVLQDDALFAGTIADNVSGFELVDEERLAEVLDVAAIADDVAAMPMRHLTHVGDMGSTLSGGQRQRLLLARALYRRPLLLVIDEGTAHLDPTHEAKVNVGIAAMGITRIVIAHRQETIAAADRVVRLVEGRFAPFPN